MIKSNITYKYKNSTDRNSYLYQNGGKNNVHFHRKKKVDK